MPYLVLKHINFFNFKSFEGYVSVGPLCKAMNCILGPNGAGKSNIIDGILFVFGKNAKQMRTKNMSELIHNMGRVEREKAFVELQFVEMQGKIEVPDSDFKIRRTVLKNGTTQYEYNGHKTEKQFVQDLLTEKGIDMESDRYLVLQGEIEQLALMKPRSGNYDEPGFIEYIETVTGSIKFIEPIEQQESKIQTLLIELQMVRDQHRILTGEIDGIQLAVQSTLNYFEAQTTRNRVRYIGNKIKEIGYIEQIQHRLQHTFLEFIEQKDQLKLKYDAAESEQRILGQQIKNNEIEREGINQKIEIVRHQMEQIQENDNAERQSAKEAMLRLDKQNKWIRESGDQQKKFFEDEQKYSQTYQNCEEKLKQLNDELTKVQQIVGEFDQEQGDQRSELNLQVMQNDILLRGCTKIFEDQQRVCDQIIKQLQQTVIPDISQLKMIEKDYKQNAELLQLVTTGLEGLHKLKIEIQSQLETQISTSAKDNQRMIEYQQKIKRLKDSLQFNVAQNDNEDRDFLVLQQLYRQSKIGKVHFRLCSAGLIDTKYEITLQVAMGVGATVFVMETMADGLDMLEFVKYNKVYTNKLDVMGKDLNPKIMEQYRNRPKESDIPGLIRLMDLIKFKEPWVEPLFFKFLKNNYFCETIEQANQIRKQYQFYENVYTLKGEISKNRGHMQTAAPYKKGFWLTQGEENKVVEFPNEDQQQLSYLEKIIQDLKLSNEESERNIADLKRDLGLTEAQIINDQQKQKGYIALDKEYFQKLTDLRAKEEQIPALKKKKADLETKLVAQQTTLKQYENDLATKTQIKAKLDKQLFDIDPPHIRQKRQLIKDLEKNIDETDKALKSSKQNAIQCGKKAQQLLTDLTRANEEIQSCQQILEQSEINYKEAEDKIKHLFQVVKDDVLSMDGVDNYLEQLYKQKEQINEKQHAIQLQLMDLQRQMEQATKIHVEQEDFVKQCDYFNSKIWQNQKQLIQQYQRDSMDEMFNWKQHMLIENKELTELDPNQKLDNTDIESYFQIKSILHKMPEVAKSILITKVDKELTLEEIELYKQNNDSISEFMNFCDKRYQYRPDESSMEVYKEFKNMVKQLKQYRQNYDQIAIDILQANKEKLELEDERQRVLISGVMQISSKLQDYYRILSRGTGSATLEPVNQTQVLQCGVDICVKPPGKPYRSISKLSGGEKTIASLALLFAIHFTHPNKVYFLDEIDAALDQSNLTSMISFLIAIAGHSQFVIVSHRQVIQDNCDKLFGVMKINNQTLIIGASVPISRVRTIAEMKVKMNQDKIKNTQQFQISLQGNEKNTEFGRIDQLQTALSTQQNMVDVFLVRQLEEEFDNDEEINLQASNYDVQRIMSKDKQIDNRVYNATRELQNLQDGWKEDEISDDDVDEQKAKASKQLKKRIARQTK